MCFSSSIFLLKYQLSLTSELQPKKGSQLKLPRSNSLAVEVILASFSSSFSFLFLDEHMVMCSNFPITILSCTFFGTRVQKKIDWIISSQKIRYLLLIILLSVTLPFRSWIVIPLIMLLCQWCFSLYSQEMYLFARWTDNRLSDRKDFNIQSEAGHMWQ